VACVGIYASALVRVAVAVLRLRDRDWLNAPIEASRILPQFSSTGARKYLCLLVLVRSHLAKVFLGPHWLRPVGIYSVACHQLHSFIPSLPTILYERDGKRFSVIANMDDVAHNA
jgi:hypothetical protein